MSGVIARNRERTVAQLDRIREALHKQPFEPFVIKMTDGATCIVRGPEWLSIPPIKRPREVAFYSVPEGRAEDEFQTHWLDLSLESEVLVPGIASIHVPAEDAGDQE
jgi:hypothetical protein